MVEAMDAARARIRWLDHIADVGMEIEAEDLEALFLAALDGLTAVMLSDPPTTSDGAREIRLTALSVEALLVEWLEEWIFLIQTERRVPVSVELELTPGSENGARWKLLATVADAALDPDRHGWRGEVKGATYHGLDVRSTAAGWQAQIVLDV